MGAAAEEDRPEFDPGRILFHGGGLFAVDKPAGVPIHRGTGHDWGVVDAVEMWVRMNPGVLDVGPGKKIRPVHLVEREASGVVLLGFTRPVTRRAKEAFQAGSVAKRLLAVVSGPLPEEATLRGKVRSKAGGRYRYQPAALDFRLLEGDERLSLVEVIPHGSQLHLVRCLFAQTGRPLAGDLRYGKPKPSRLFLEKFGTPHFLLHAWRLTLPEGIVGRERTFEAPVPESFRQLCRKKGWKEDRLA